MNPEQSKFDAWLTTPPESDHNVNLVIVEVYGKNWYEPVARDAAPDIKEATINLKEIINRLEKEATVSMTAYGHRGIKDVIAEEFVEVDPEDESTIEEAISSLKSFLEDPTANAIEYCREDLP